MTHITKQEYQLQSKQCTNSHWVARFLAKPNQECCECIFSCKVIVKHESGHEYIITEEEYNNIFNATQQPTHITKQVIEELREIIAHKLDDLILEVDPKRITRQRMDKLSYEYADKILYVFTSTLQSNTESLQLYSLKELQDLEEDFSFEVSGHKADPYIPFTEWLSKRISQTTDKAASKETKC